MLAARIVHLACSDRVARHTGFWWGLAEGLVFFVVPDVFISFAALFSLRAGAMAWLFSIAGSLVAVTIIYLLVVVLGIDYLGFLDRVPGIPASMITGVNDMITMDGLPYTPLLALTGIPLKLYSATAFALGTPFASVLLWTVFARIVRIAPTYLLAAIARTMFGRWIDTRAVGWTVFLVIVWVVFYVFYFSAVGGL